MIIGFIIIGSTTCNHQKKQQDIPDVAYKARAFSEPIEPVMLYNYAITGIGFKLVAGTHVFYGEHETYTKTFSHDTVVKNPMAFYTQLFGDTTKPKPSPQIKVKYNHYLLNGSDTLFQLLYLQVQSPLDVTPRQLQTIKNWLNTNIKIDSTLKQ